MRKGATTEGHALRVLRLEVVSCSPSAWTKKDDHPPTSTIGSRRIAQFEDPEGDIIRLVRG